MRNLAFVNVYSGYITRIKPNLFEGWSGCRIDARLRLPVFSRGGRSAIFLPRRASLREPTLALDEKKDFVVEPS